MSYLKKAVTRITLDLSMSDVQKSITCTRGDRLRLLEIIVTNEGKPFQLPPRWSAMLMGTKPDNTALANGCVVEEGRIVYDFESGYHIATCAGRFAVTVWIYDEEGVPVAGPKIWVNVIESGAQQIVESDSQFNVLLEQDAEILALQLKDKAVDEEISGLKEKDAQVDEEIKTLSSRLGNVVRSSVITIDPSRWTDVSPHEAKINISVPGGTERRSTVLLIPKNKETRDESQAIELTVTTSWTMDQAMTIMVTMGRQNTDPPTIPLSYLALVVYDEEASEDSTVTVEFVGVVNLPDELMEREVKRALEALGVTEDLITTMGDVDAVQKDISAAKMSIEMAKDNIAEAKQDIDQAKQDIDQAKQDIDQAKTDIDQAKQQIENTVTVGSFTVLGSSLKTDSDYIVPFPEVDNGDSLFIYPITDNAKMLARKYRISVNTSPKNDNGKYSVLMRKHTMEANPTDSIQFGFVRLNDNGVTTPSVSFIGVDYTDLEAISIDLSSLDDGEVVETFSDGTTKTTTIEYDADGNPVKITDGDGNVTVLTW